MCEVLLAAMYSDDARSMRAPPASPIHAATTGSTPACFSLNAGTHYSPAIVRGVERATEAWADPHRDNVSLTSLARHDSATARPPAGASDATTGGTCQPLVFSSGTASSHAACMAGSAGPFTATSTARKHPSAHAAPSRKKAARAADNAFGAFGASGAAVAALSQLGVASGVVLQERAAQPSSNSLNLQLRTAMPSPPLAIAATPPCLQQPALPVASTSTRSADTARTQAALMAAMAAACEHGHDDVCSALLRHAHWLLWTCGHQPAHDLRPALHVAVAAGKHTVCKLLLRAGAKPDTSVLGTACSAGSADVLRVLLKHSTIGLELHAPTAGGLLYSLLHRAITANQLDVVKELLQTRVSSALLTIRGNTRAGPGGAVTVADVPATDEDGGCEPPLVLAARTGNTAMCAAILSYISVETRVGAGLDQAIARVGKRPAGIIEMDEQVPLLVELLLRAGARYPVPSLFVHQPVCGSLLRAAAAAGADLTVRHMLEPLPRCSGERYERLEAAMRCAVGIAVMNGSMEVLSLLLRFGKPLGCDLPRLVDTRDADDEHDEDWTPLMHAASRGDLRMCRLLCEHGADVNAGDDAGRTCLSITASSSRADILALLLSHGACPTRALTQACVARSDVGAQTVTALLDVGASLRGHAQRGLTMLHLAASTGHVATVIALLTRGAEMEATDTDGNTPLMCAAMHGHSAVCDALVKMNKACTSARNNNNMTALCIAATHGHAQFCELILRLQSEHDAGESAAVDTSSIVDTEVTPPGGVPGTTSLMLAAEAGHADVVDTLIKRGASVTLARDADGYTAWHAAAQRGHTAVLDVLLHHGAHIAGFTGHKFEMAALAGHTSVCRHMIVRHKVNVLAQLASCVIRGDVVTCSAIFRMKLPSCPIDSRLPFPPDSAVAGTLTALMLAAQCGHATLCTSLLAQRADATVCDASSHCAIQLAVIHRHVDVVNACLDGTPNGSKRRAMLSRALHAAVSAHLDEISNLLLRRGAVVNSELVASVVKVGDARSLEWTLQHLPEALNLDVAHNRLVKDAPPLFSAAQSGRTDLCDLLLDAGAVVDVRAGGQQRLTPLMAAAQAGMTACCATLIARGASVHAADNHGRTALHLAVAAGRVSVVSLLLIHGAAVNVEDRTGMLVLHVAAAGRKLGSTSTNMRAAVTMIELLAAAGAEMESRVTEAGAMLSQTALMIAAAAGNAMVCAALLRCGADVNAVTCLGRGRPIATPLSLAVTGNHWQACAMLLRSRRVNGAIAPNAIAAAGLPTAAVMASAALSALHVDALYRRGHITESVAGGGGSVAAQTARHAAAHGGRCSDAGRVAALQRFAQ